MRELINKLFSNKRIAYIVSTVVLFLFCLALNISFSAFTHSASDAIANIKVNEFAYAMTINGKSGVMLKASANDKTRANISITALNKLISKYELVYTLCSDENCETVINKPAGLTIEYSSRTIDPINGEIEADGNRNMRIIVTNTTSSDYYIKLDINAGFEHNELELLGLISSMYDEDDVIIAAYVDGNLQTTFPTSEMYDAVADCKVNGNSTTATGTVNWDGTKWYVDVHNATTGETRCNVSFTRVVPIQFNESILQKNGGAEFIAAKTSPSFGTVSTTNEGLYTATDDYGTSYYFRGAVNNNWVTFADAYWRIIRINGDGSVRMIYSGTTAPNESQAVVMNTAGTNYSTTAFAASSSSPYAVGYTENLYLTEANSTIATATDTWYNAAIASSYADFIQNDLFCNDRAITSGDGLSTKAATVYAPYTRANASSAVLTCSQAADKYTATGGTSGNEKLSSPAALITMDEIIMAGGGYGSSKANTSFYLYTGQSYWTMSPSQFVYELFGASKYAAVMNMTTTGYLNQVNVTTSSGLRPVINLKVNTGVTGRGTYNNPYKVRELMTE